MKIFDTTLRDGEQAPGASMNETEKLEIAKQLERMGVDVIEAGFPIVSKGDFDSVALIAREVRGSRIAGLARAIDNDVRVCWDAVREAEAPRIHTFVSTSPIHLKYQIKKTADEVRVITREAVSLAAQLAAQHPDGDVEFSAMDASRSEPEYLAEILGIAIDCGATTINVPDTVGYALPLEWGEFIAELYRLCPPWPTSPSACTATTTSAWRRPTRWPPCGLAPARSSAPSTASANAPATPRSKRSSWRSSRGATTSARPPASTPSELVPRAAAW